MKLLMVGSLQFWRTCSSTLWHGAAAMLMSVFVSAFLTVANGQGSFIPEQATVVLVSSLTGDVESENVYHDQLQAWLEIVAMRNPRRTVVLCDAPESVSLPAKDENKVFKAGRTNFLGLATMLAGETNPVVMIAWGHGGRQGSTPVFHVRGPRLTPADFHAVADKIPAASHWILLFRGSGAFASQLAGPGRHVLSSESETMFNSDPVSMSLLLKLVKTNPKISFAKLAEELGRTTAAWYTERHLARTEEPTLWAGNDKPRLLATSSPENSPPADKPEPSESQQQKAILEPTPVDLPAFWKEIGRVDASKFPEADAVILRRHLSFTLGSSPAVTTEQDEFIQVLTLEGKRFGDFDVSYAPPFEEIYFLDCEVLRPDGMANISAAARLDGDPAWRGIAGGGNDGRGECAPGRAVPFCLGAHRRR